MPVPLGREDIRTTDDVIDAVRFIGRQRPLLGGVVIKHDDSGAGDGNVVLDLRLMHHADEMYEAVRRVVQRLADRRATDREPSPAWPQAASEG